MAGAAEIDKMSGIYSVVHDDGNGTFEMTCVEAEQFQPIRTGKGHAMSCAAMRSHRHADLEGMEARS